MATEDAKSENFNYIVRVSNTDLDGEKKIVNAMRKIKGISFMYASAVCNAAGVDRQAQTGLLSDKDIKKIQTVLDDPTQAGLPAWLLNRRKDYETGEDKHNLTNDLIITHDDDIKRLKKIRAYRGVRHTNDLPVRGQRTKSNFRKNKGKK